MARPFASHRGTDRRPRHTVGPAGPRRAASGAARVALTVVPLAVLALAGGCRASEPTPAEPGGVEVVSLTVIPIPPVGASDIRGVVTRSDAAGRDLGTVAGVRIAVLRVEVDPAATDTATARKTLVPVGTVTSAANGTFELRGVGRGYFALDAQPPAGAGLKPGRAWSVSLVPSDPARAIVYLYPGP